MRRLGLLLLLLASVVVLVGDRRSCAAEDGCDIIYMGNKVCSNCCFGGVCQIKCP